MNFTTKWTREQYDRPTYLTGLFFHNIARRWPTCFVKDPYGNWAADMEIIQLEEGGEQSEQKDLYTNQLQFVFEPIKDWHITIDGSMRQTTQSTQWAVLPIYGYDADNNPYLLSWNGGAAGYSEVQDYRYGEDYYSTNIYTDYSKTINGHYFKVMAGFNAELYKNNSLTGFGTDLVTPTVPELNATQDNQKAYNGKGEYAMAGFFGRINYNYKEKYILEANLRYDGSSRFIGDKRWGLFPSFSAGWNIAREEFFAPLNNIIGTLKLRGSWGQLGNNNTESYYPFYQSMPTGVESSGWLIGGAKQNVAGLPGIVSSLLTWETVQSWDAGFDFGMFNNRFTGSFSYYNRLTKDMVAAAPNLPGILGATPPNLNNADLKSYGWELELSWRDRIQDFNYGVRLTLDDNQEKITRYYNPTGNLGTYYDGRMVGEIWGYTTVGIAQSQEEMDKHLENNKPNWGTGWAAGDVMFADLNGDGIVSNGSNTLEDHGDITIIGNNKPRYKFGLTLDGAWKGIDFSVFFQGVLKRDYMLSGPYFWGANGGQWQSTCFVEHLDYWTPENTDAYYPRPDFSSTKNQQTQTGYLQNAAYLRVKNAQIGYTLPKIWTKKAGMESVRIYVSGDNLLTFSDMISVFDPETLGGDWGDGKLYPLQRTISVGINVNF
jgi:TonB-linked SusC/RagA family outer membrane protein